MMKFEVKKNEVSEREEEFKKVLRGIHYVEVDGKIEYQNKKCSIT